MRHKVLATAMLAVSLVSTGCMRSMTSGTIRPDAMSVSVRFVLPSEQERHAGLDTSNDVQLAVDSTYEGFSGWENEEDATVRTPGAYHVALWGGPYNGVNVTTRPTTLVPGSYTFAYFDHPNDSVVQGWLDVNKTAGDLLSMLTQWRDGIPAQKQRLAYEFEIDGRMEVSDPDVFRSFQKQVQAYDRLEGRLNAAIGAERRAVGLRRENAQDLLRQADVVIMPGEDTFFRSTTRAAFTTEELETVRNGDAVTKLVLVADYDEAQWKLRQLNQVYDDLSRFKEVLRQEVDRLERRKGLFLLTDHLHNHDQRFVENEMRLQSTLDLIDRFNRHTADLSERRMGLAFVASLFAPDADDSALDRELRDLLRERTVLEAERRRLGQLIDEIDGGSVRRVTLERNRQDVIASIDAVDYQLRNVNDAQTALAAMAESTDVIHRHNDRRLLTTTFVADTLPFGIRRAVEQEAMMTIRLQASDKVFAPRPTGVASAVPAFTPFYTNEAFLSDEDDAPYVETPYETAYERPHETPHRAATVVCDRDEPTTWQPEQTERTRKPSGSGSCGCPWFVRLLVPPCWFAHSTGDQATRTTQRQRDDHPRMTTLASQRDDHNQQRPQAKPAKKGCQLPCFIRWLVPPCWFADRNDRPAQTTQRYRDDRPRRTALASQRDDGRPESESCDCPWLIRLLVPPCWFAD